MMMMSEFVDPFLAKYPGARIAEGASIHESCRVDPGAQIGAEAVLEPNVVICKNVKIFGKVHIERAVKWKEGSDLGALAGRPVRLRFVMREADLFSFRFSGQ